MNTLQDANCTLETVLRTMKKRHSSVNVQQTAIKQGQSVIDHAIGQFPGIANALEVTIDVAAFKSRSAAVNASVEGAAAFHAYLGLVAHAGGEFTFTSHLPFLLTRDGVYNRQFDDIGSYGSGERAAESASFFNTGFVDYRGDGTDQLVRINIGDYGGAAHSASSRRLICSFVPDEVLAVRLAHVADDGHSPWAIKKSGVYECHDAPTALEHNAIFRGLSYVPSLGNETIDSSWPVSYVMTTDFNATIEEHNTFEKLRETMVNIKEKGVDCSIPDGLVAEIGNNGIILYDAATYTPKTAINVGTDISQVFTWQRALRVLARSIMVPSNVVRYDAENGPCFAVARTDEGATLYELPHFFDKPFSAVPVKELTRYAATEIYRAKLLGREGTLYRGDDAVRRLHVVPITLVF